MVRTVVQTSPATTSIQSCWSLSRKRIGWRLWTMTRMISKVPRLRSQGSKDLAVNTIRVCPSTFHQHSSILGGVRPTKLTTMAQSVKSLRLRTWMSRYRFPAKAGAITSRRWRFEEPVLLKIAIIVTRELKPTKTNLHTMPIWLKDTTTNSTVDLWWARVGSETFLDVRRASRNGWIVMVGASTAQVSTSTEALWTKVAESTIRWWRCETASTGRETESVHSHCERASQQARVPKKPTLFFDSEFCSIYLIYQSVVVLPQLKFVACELFCHQHMLSTQVAAEQVAQVVVHLELAIEALWNGTLMGRRVVRFNLLLIIELLLDLDLWVCLQLVCRMFPSAG